MAENAPEPSRPAVLSRAQASLPGRRAIVIGAGSFGTAIAVLLARAGVRATLQTRTNVQASTLAESRENAKYLPGVELPPPLRIESVANGVSRADFVFLAIPSTALGEVIGDMSGRGLGRANALVSLCKGLVPPDGATGDDYPASAVWRSPNCLHRRPGTRPGDGQSRRGARGCIAR